MKKSNFITAMQDLKSLSCMFIYTIFYPDEMHLEQGWNLQETENVPYTTM